MDQHHEDVHLLPFERNKKVQERKQKKLRRKYENVNPRSIKFYKVTVKDDNDTAELEKIRENQQKAVKEQREMDRDTYTRGL